MAEVTAFILAGGLSSRFGSNKALALWEGRPLLSHMADLLAPVAETRKVLAKDPGIYAALGLSVPVLKDSVERRHPLAGVLSALRAADTEWVFVTACDMPLLRPVLVTALAKATEGHDAVVPVWKGKFQTLCALYSQRCAAPIETLLKQERAPCVELYPRVRTRFYSEEEVARVDPAGASFLDVDTPDEFRSAEAAR